MTKSDTRTPQTLQEARDCYASFLAKLPHEAAHNFSDAQIHAEIDALLELLASMQAFVEPSFPEAERAELEEQIWQALRPQRS